MQALSKAEAGKTYRIQWMIANAAISDFFQQMGLEEGMPIKLIQEYYGSVLVRYQGHVFGISNEIAERITVSSDPFIISGRTAMQLQ